MNPKVRRIGWMLVLASLALSGLSACSFSSLFGAGAGLGFAAFVTAVLLLLGTTQTGCADLGPCLSPPLPDANVGPCLTQAPPDANVGPCLGALPPDADLGPCLSPMPPDAAVGPCLDVQPPDADLGPCLSQPAPDTGVGVCLSVEPPDGGLGPCLSPPLDPDASADARDPARPGSEALASANRQQALERLQDRLPDDVKARLGLKKA